MSYGDVTKRAGRSGTSAQVHNINYSHLNSKKASRRYERCEASTDESARDFQIVSLAGWNVISNGSGFSNNGWASSETPEVDRTAFCRLLALGLAPFSFSLMA